MKIKDRAKPKEPPVPAGTYRGRLVHIIDIGEQLCKGKKGDFYQNQVVFTFELIGKTKEVDGQQKPVDLSRTFGFTRGANSNFRKFVQDWTGLKMSDEVWDEFDPYPLLRKEAMLNVVHNDTGEYANISTAMQPFEGDVYPDATMPILYFDMDHWDDALFAQLPEWAQDRIKKSTQYQKEHLPAETVAVQQPQQPQAGFQMPANMPGVNFQAAMQQAAYTRPQSAAAPNTGSVSPF